MLVANASNDGPRRSPWSQMAAREGRPETASPDLSIILTLLVMFQLLAKPYSLSAGLWHAAALSGLIGEDKTDGTFVRGAKLFWSLAIVLFAVLIPLWTRVSWQHQGLRRHDLWRYIVGWGIGAGLSAYMLSAAIYGSTTELSQHYKVAGPVSLISLLFLALEVHTGSKFERRVVQGRTVGTAATGDVLRSAT